MVAVFDKLKIRFAVSVVWTMKGKLAEAIRGFQATEADGVWHLHRGLVRIRDPRHRAILFAHSLEEEAHAEEFADAYRHYGEHAMKPAPYEREDLYAESEPLWKTFAYVHQGEKDATHRFRLIEGSLDRGRLKDSLGRIVRDEEGHVDLTNRMLIEMGASDRAIRSELGRVRRSRVWQAWLRIGKRVVDKLATLLLSVSYFLFGPLLFVFARRRLRSRVVEFDNCRLKRLSE
jgi:hypothetical protein